MIDSLRDSTSYFPVKESPSSKRRIVEFSTAPPKFQRIFFSNHVSGSLVPISRNVARAPMTQLIVGTPSQMRRPLLQQLNEHPWMDYAAAHIRQAAPHFVGHSVSRASPFRVPKVGRRDTRVIYLGQISIESLTGSKHSRSADSSEFEFGERLAIRKFTFPSRFVSIHKRRIKRIM
jgi:hypothetical protein